MNHQILENELKDSHLNPILNHFFSKKDDYKFRCPEVNLPERLERTEYLKKPDAIVSKIDISHFNYTKLVGEVKNDTYNTESLLVLFDKYKLAPYGKDIIDKGLSKVILYQAIGKYNKPFKFKQ